MSKLLFVVLILAWCCASHAQNTYLDSTFGTNGFVITEVGSGTSGSLRDVVIQPDGKIVATGVVSGTATVVRYNSNGTLDHTFGTGGIYQPPYSALQNSSGQAVVLQPDGKILIGCKGYESAGGTIHDFIAIRLLTNGMPDSSFGTNGIAIVYKPGNDYLNDIALQPDGKIVLCGTASSSSLGFARLLADGQVDAAFGTSGFSVFHLASYGGVANSVVLLADGKMLAGGYNSFSGPRGYDFFVARFQNNGAPDSSFGTNGIVYTDLSQSDFYGYIALQADGKIVQTGKTGGLFSSDMVVLRYHENGSLDTSFNTTGYRVIDFYGNSDAAFAIRDQSDGKIVIAGSAVSSGPRMMSLARINANGIPDSSFGENGLVSCHFNEEATDLRKFVFWSDDKIIAVGSYTDGGADKFCIAKIKPQSAAFVSMVNEPESGLLVYPNPARDVVYIKSVFRVSSIEVRDAMGRLVKRVSGSDRVYLSGWQGGVYSLGVRLENGVVLKQKITVIK